MTNPRDDLMALADRLRELVFRQGQIDWDALIKIEIDLRLAASRPATQVVDREAVAGTVARVMHAHGLREGNWDEGNWAAASSIEDVAKEIAEALHATAPAPSSDHPALNWSLSDDAKQRLAELENHARQSAPSLNGVIAAAPAPDAKGEPVAWDHATKGGAS